MKGDERAGPDAVAGVHIGEVVERTGLSHRTLRYYEEMGLISPTARTTGGFRLYDQAGIDRVLLIKPMKPLGFTVDDMRRLLDALDTINDPSSHHQQVKSARSVVASIDTETRKKVADLERSLRAARTFEQELRSFTPPPESPESTT